MPAWRLCWSRVRRSLWRGVPSRAFLPTRGQQGGLRRAPLSVGCWPRCKAALCSDGAVRRFPPACSAPRGAAAWGTWGPWASRKGRRLSFWVEVFLMAPRSFRFWCKFLQVLFRIPSARLMAATRPPVQVAARSRRGAAWATPAAFHRGDLSAARLLGNEIFWSRTAVPHPS